MQQQKLESPATHGGHLYVAHYAGRAKVKGNHEEGGEGGGGMAGRDGGRGDGGADPFLVVLFDKLQRRATFGHMSATFGHVSASRWKVANPHFARINVAFFSHGYSSVGKG